MIGKAKAYAAGIIATITAVSVAAADGAVDSADVGLLTASIAATFGLTWLVSNQTILFLKAIAGSSGAGWTAWVAAGTDGSVTGNDWYTILAAAIGGIAVYWTTNEEPPPAPAPGPA